MAAAAHAASAMPNFLILEHCRLHPWFNDVQKVAVPIVDGCVDVATLRQRPGLGIELDLEKIQSCPWAPLPPLIYTGKDGAALAHQ
jgi:L-alanine-DL-glutamate epimerase-like enolase superfamily enzyme